MLQARACGCIRACVSVRVCVENANNNREQRSGRSVCEGGVRCQWPSHSSLQMRAHLSTVDTKTACMSASLFFTTHQNQFWTDLSGVTMWVTQSNIESLPNISLISFHSDNSSHTTELRTWNEKENRFQNYADLLLARLYTQFVFPFLIPNKTQRVRARARKNN